MKKALTLSIIIPVYNEESRLARCLDAIAAQKVPPTEVIVVDNNSTDDSMAIAGKYPFVRIVTEKRQGFTYARNAGFDAAKGDILGRIDADAIIASDWVKNVLHAFETSKVDGVTGLGSADVLPRIGWPKTVLWSWWYFMWMKGVYRLPVLWGANMAIRRSAWRRIRSAAIMDNQLVHEDQDISLCILEHGGSLQRIPGMRITTGGQTYHYFPKLIRYTLRIYSTKQLHARRQSYQDLQRSPPLWFMACLFIIVGPFLFIPFFTISLVLFPLDYAMKKLGRADSWLD